MGVYIGLPTVATRSPFLPLPFVWYIYLLDCGIPAHGQDACKADHFSFLILKDCPDCWRTGTFGFYWPQTQHPQPLTFLTRLVRPTSSMLASEYRGHGVAGPGWFLGGPSCHHHA